MRKYKDYHLVFIYVILTYIISGIGYLFWINGDETRALFLFVPILAPLISSCVVIVLSKGCVRINLKKCSITGLLVGAMIPIIYYSVSILVYLFCGNTLHDFHMSGQEIITLCIQWTFAAFCEEIGWRGFSSLPLVWFVSHLSMEY
ncbi:MAG: hypothetical protein PUC65_10245 [Clostridiales bacterium]|nr:hypothetical protein [Clostridiales bacterium]